MSIKSERRKFYAANVEAKPAECKAHEPLYIEWVKRANAFMVKACVPGTAELRADFVLPGTVATVEPVAEPVVPTVRIPGNAKSDRELYDGFILAQQMKIAEEMGWEGEPWTDFWKPQKHGANARRRPSLEFCKGSLKVAWPHLTEEMQRLHDAGVWRWVTFSEFRAEQVAARRAEAEAKTEELAEEHAAYVASQLAANDAGWNVCEIAAGEACKDLANCAESCQPF